MAFNLNITSTKEDKPPVSFMYGTAGIGKSTEASKLDDVFFVLTEDGAHSLDVPTNNFAADGEKERNVAKNFQEVLEVLKALGREEHPFKTVVIDTVSALEDLIHREVAEDAGKPDISSIGFGKGYEAALGKFKEFFALLKALRDIKGIHPVMIGHSRIAKVSNPSGDSWDAYSPMLHAKVAEYVIKECDALFFVKPKVFVKKETSGMQEVTKGVGGETAVVYTTKTATHEAKHRSDPNKGQMPKEMAFDLKEVFKAYKEVN